MSKKYLSMVMIAMLALITSCGSSSTSDTNDNNNTNTNLGVDLAACGGANKGCITGSVKNMTGGVVPSVTVKLGATTLATANTDGWYSINDLTAGDNVICYQATGYVTKCKTVTVTEAKTTPVTSVVLPERGDAITVANAQNAGANAADTATTGKITFDSANTVCDANGTAVTGSIDCYLTPIDVTDTTAMTAGPDSFVAISAADGRGSMISSAMMEVTCEQAGEELNICTGKTATVRLPVYGDCTAGALPGWRFDETTGQWTEYSTADFTPTCGATGDETDSYFTGQVDHLTWINGDRWSADACLTGLVYSQATTATGEPVTVSCWGAGWRNEVQVDPDNGRFYVPVPVGRGYTCKVADDTRTLDSSDWISGTASLTATTFPVTDATNCAEIGNFVFANPILTTTFTWGMDPADLDSHTILSGDSMHVYFGDKARSVESLLKGSLTAAPYIALDTDDTTSYGPEVTTVMPSVANGDYCFFIYKYSGTGSISQSSTDAEGNAKSASITVTGKDIAKTFTIPSSNPNDYDYWRVYTFTVADGAVTAFGEKNDLVETEPTDCNW